MYNNLNYLVSAFPVDTELSVAEFDQWAISHNLISDPETTDKQSPAWAQLLRQRNSLRGMLNNAALNTELPQHIRINIDVATHGKSYVIVKLDDKAIDELHALPELIQNKFGNKHKQILRMIQSIDYISLTPAKQLELSLLEKEGIKVKKRIRQVIEDYEERIDEAGVALTNMQQTQLPDLSQ